MLFSSIVFLTLFLPLSFVCHWSAPTVKTKNIILLLFSLMFYAWGEPKYIVTMLVTITISYYAALLLDTQTLRRYKLLILTFSIAVILSLLFYFKYFNFVMGNLNMLFAHLNLDVIFSSHNVIMPIGISFYSFQAISYLVDVYRQEVSSQKNYINLALYISLFPQLVAGPIVRYIDICKEITQRQFSTSETYYGIIRFIQGLAKKVLIANTLGEYADEIFNLDQGLDFTTAWCAAICYSLQLYFDFSGYSDMAIGLGKMFGFNFLENFNYPYKAKSVTEFWRRWHISLSSWFRDYVYISLGGNRVGSKIRVVFNIFIVFLLTGIWHGANWTFLVWGLWHGLFVILEKVFSKSFAKIPTVIKHIYTLLVVILGWVIFRSESLTQAKYFIDHMFKFNYHKLVSIDAILNQAQMVALFIGVLLAIGAFNNKLTDKFNNNTISLSFINVGYLLLLLFTFIFLIANTFNPFIYFRF